MIRLVINADDLGLHPRLDEGIFAAHTDGVVTSATCGAPNSLKFSSACRCAPARSPRAMPTLSYRPKPQVRRRDW